jgi:hypothetical protein
MHLAFTAPAPSSPSAACEGFPPYPAHARNARAPVPASSSFQAGHRPGCAALSGAGAVLDLLFGRQQSNLRISLLLFRARLRLVPVNAHPVNTHPVNTHTVEHTPRELNTHPVNSHYVNAHVGPDWPCLCEHRRNRRFKDLSARTRSVLLRGNIKGLYPRRAGALHLLPQVPRVHEVSQGIFVVPSSSFIFHVDHYVFSLPCRILTKSFPPRHYDSARKKPEGFCFTHTVEMYRC